MLGQVMTRYYLLGHVRTR